jgi:hypothetical protein
MQLSDLKDINNFIATSGGHTSPPLLSRIKDILLNVGLLIELHYPTWTVQN